MFAARILQRGLSSLEQNLIAQKYQCFSAKSNKCINSVIFLGGGLEKLQGGIKEEEYFTSINYGLMSKILEQQQKETAGKEYLQNWDEYQKTLDHAALFESSLMNKHKNCLEEAFFMNESAECVKLMKERTKAENINDPISEFDVSNETDDNRKQDTTKQ